MACPQAEIDDTNWLLPQPLTGSSRQLADAASHKPGNNRAKITLARFTVLLTLPRSERSTAVLETTLGYELLSVRTKPVPERVFAAANLFGFKACTNVEILSQLPEMHLLQCCAMVVMLRIEFTASMLERVVKQVEQNLL